MASKSISVPDARFSCQSCGRCCRMWSVTVDEQTVGRLRQHDWTGVGAGDPFVPNPGPGDPFRIRMVEGRCFFLDAHNHCRIHSELGYEAKPAGCKAFPLHYTEIAGTSYARLSFYCPTVSENRGSKLSDQMRWLRAVRKSAGDVARKLPPRLHGDLELSARDLGQIETQLRRWIERKGRPLHARLATCAGLLRWIVEQRDPGEGAAKGSAALSALLTRALRVGEDELEQKGREGGSAARAGPIFSLFLAGDCPPTKLARIGRFFSVRLFGLGLFPLRSFVLGAKASAKRLRRIPFDLPLVDDELLTRFFLHKLEGRRHLAADLDLVSGLNLMIVAYGVIHLLTRLGAVHGGRGEPQRDDVARAVQAADLLVLEHTTIHHKPTFSLLVDSILGQPDLGASVLARVVRT